MEEHYRQREVYATEIVKALASNDLALLQENTYKDIYKLTSEATCHLFTGFTSLELAPPVFYWLYQYSTGPTSIALTLPV